jgi:hypothetical protein
VGRGTQTGVSFLNPGTIIVAEHSIGCYIEVDFPSPQSASRPPTATHMFALAQLTLKRANVVGVFVRVQVCPPSLVLRTVPVSPTT